MYKREYPPIFDAGFKEIMLWQLDGLFLDGFFDNGHRKYLIDRFKVFVEEFQKLNISAEIWLDGSFTTLKPEPKDIDVVFVLANKDVDSLDSIKSAIFESLLINRDEVLVKYGLDVYFIPSDNGYEKDKWIQTYGYDANKINTKGIFKIVL